VQQALDSMAALDREVLALRHFEQLSNAETAQVLGVSEAAASVRFIRALERLKAILAGIPGFLPGNSGDR
jgi:RNA polymerase sigma-70 factor (ECF subfamily)